jgi:hypothetical protein
VEELMTAKHSPTRSPTRSPTASEWGSSAIWAGLDFTTGSLDAAVTASGSTNGTRINSSGVLVDGTAPRFDYTSAGVSNGILVEPARTNLLTYSDDLTNAWTMQNGTAAYNQVGPRGTANSASRFTCSAVSANNVRFYQLNITSTAAVHTYVCWLKAGSGVTHVHIKIGTDTQNYGRCINLSTGADTAGYYDGGTLATDPTSTTVESLAGGWLVSMVLPAFAGANQADILIYAAKSFVTTAENFTTSDYFDISCQQLELGAYSTSNILTTAATVTRTADVVKFTPPAGVTDIRITYQDDTTADVSVTPEVEYTFATGQKGIKTVVDIS